MPRKKTARAIPPGFYTPETLPPISAGAKKILADVRKRVSEEQGRPRLEGSFLPGGTPVALKLKDSGRRVGLKLKES